MKVKILKIYKNRDEIKKIVNKIKNYSFNDLGKHEHFKFSLMEKATDFNLLQKTFPKFDRIKTIQLRKNKKGQKHHSLNYEISDGTYVIISLALDKNPPMIINGFHSKTNYKKFEKKLKKYYGKKFI